MSREQTISAVRKHKIIAILRRLPLSELPAVADALYEGGIRLIEVTFDQSGELKPTADAIALLASRYPDLLAGAGTVMTAEQLRMALDAGAKYMISPHTDTEIIKSTREAGAVSMPGALTPTEIVTAYNAGADFVKVFPAESLGMGYIKAIRAPISHIPLLAVGGVDASNLADWFKIGICGVGIGSNILDRDALAARNYTAITAQARKYADIAASIS